MSFLAEVLSEDIDKEADNVVQFELVEVADNTDFVGDDIMFFVGVTKKRKTDVNTSLISIECTIDKITEAHTRLTV
jgi:hypothetical protein